ncbi:putative S-layer protein [Xenococcus sp. PCC 7305]|uniref:S-layer homology domain-containing protein n=1 Tax=Xenococcus sp. PCC 7305 TaxID=102125 RepID=UPI0002ABB11C|nr:S-layer homology domain-containing protein [Xenococcus sp. PCC 7305]ELS03157.1 putative S-layer protein [Xenococcus sp. PCC 7305]
MLARRLQPKALRSTITLLVLSLLTSCSNSEALENFVNADPNLRREQNSENPRPNSTVNSSQNNQETSSQSENNQTEPEPEILPSSNSEQITEDLSSNDLSDFPTTLPEEIPLYPQAELQQTDPELTAESGSLTLRSLDNITDVANYYQSQLQTQEWEIIQPFSLDPDGNSQSTIASKNNLKIKISLAELLDTNEDNSSQTKIDIAYKPFIPNLSSTDLEPNIESEVLPNSAEDYPEATAVIPELATGSDAIQTTTTNFADLAEVREQLQQAVQDVAALGILTPQTKDSPPQLAPNELITRRDYVRWLVSANNKFHENSPGNKIHLTKKTSQTAFKDIDINDPDFGEIQGLAEAGLIPSILTSDSNNVLFRPDAALTREDLISWKVPLDLRAALPKASIETIEETWGFQDVAKIDSQAIRALFSDYQNGDRSNVRRVFGFTTLFQPKKGVTRAEAAASLWYFGYQDDGISAEELLDISIN